MVGRLVEQGKVWVDQPAVAMLLSPGFPGDQQQRQPDEQQQVGGSSTCRRDHGGAAREQRREEKRKQSLVDQGSREGHVDTASIGGEVEGGIPASRPNVQELCQGSLDEGEVVHLKRVEQEGEVRVPSSQARVTSLKSRIFNRALTA